MERIYLTDLEKEILKKAHRDGIDELDIKNYTEDDYFYACCSLERLGLLEMCGLLEPKESSITEKGIKYKEMNPTLANPIPEDEKWRKDRKIAIVAIIISIISLISNIAIWIVR